MATTRSSRGSPSGRVPMLPSDALFWRAEGAMAAVRPQVGGLLILDRAPDRNSVRAAIERLIVCAPRLQQRVVDLPLPLALPEWEDDPHFDLDYHLREVVLPQPGNQRRLLDFAGSVLVTPLDHLRPLWEAYVIGGLEGGRAGVMFKLHHSIIDGVGSMALFEALTQEHPADPVRVPPRRRHRDSAQAPRSPLVTERVRNAASELGTSMERIGRVAAHPLRAWQRLLQTAGTLGGLIREFNAHAVKDPLADTSGDIGRRLDALKLSLLRLWRIKDALGVTLNDLVLTAVAGAVGRYHAYCGAPVKELECVVPMNLRQAHEREVVGNRVGAFIVPLPVGERDPLRRLNKIRRQTTAAKRAGGGGSGSQFLLQALALIPSAAFRAASRTIRGKIGLICTNVPGPRTPRYLAGAKVEVICPFLPAMFGIPLTVALLSYGDVYAVGIDTDSAAIRRPELLCHYIVDAFDEIERRALRTGRDRPHRARGSQIERGATALVGKPTAA